MNVAMPGRGSPQAPPDFRPPARTLGSNARPFGRTTGIHVVPHVVRPARGLHRNAAGGVRGDYFLVRPLRKTVLGAFAARS